jgi:hypothetical protein
MGPTCSIKLHQTQQSNHVGSQNDIKVHSNSINATQKFFKHLARFEMPMYVPSNYIELTQSPSFSLYYSIKINRP